MNGAIARLDRGGEYGPAGPEAQAADDALRTALVDSRRRWRDFVSLAADIAYETDAEGRFVFLFPEVVLGWPAATLLGQPAELLLADADGTCGFNPFDLDGPVRRRRAWLRRPDGGSVCVAIAGAPLLGAEGRIAGTRGLGHDVTGKDAHEGRIAGALRRCELLEHILWQMRREVLAERMMRCALEALATALGAEGCAVIDLLGDGVQSTVLHQIGVADPDLLNAATDLLEAHDREPAQGMASDGRQILVCPSVQRYGEHAGVVLWRAPGARGWDGDERAIAGSVTGVIRVILDHDAIQREMARQARTDPLSGLLNRRAFLDEVTRRLERLEREALPGTLMFIDLDNFKALNDHSGHDAGDEAICIAAGLLRETVRPTDLIARFGGDEFALWLDGADELAAAERADNLCTAGPAALAHLCDGLAAPVSMSIGIATRWPGQDEDVEALIHRADQAMYDAKRSGRGHWRVSRPELGG